MTEREIAPRGKEEVTQHEGTRAGRNYRPDVDICESAEGLTLWADVPGVDEKTVSIELADGVLTIQGQVDVAQYAELEPAYTEYNVGNYVRRFSISDDIDGERISARVTHGVLEVQLPKAERAKPRRIAVATA